MAERPMAKKWYAVHTYSGFENKVKRSLEERIRQGGLGEQVGEILIPMEQVVEMVKGEKRTSKRKYFPGYVLVQMEMNDATWHLVKGTPKVTGFVGSAKTPRDVPAISDAQVLVIDGPFSNFNGTVEEVKPDKGKVRVLVSIFGRATPVELDFMQVEKT